MSGKGRGRGKVSSEAKKTNMGESISTSTSESSIQKSPGNQEESRPLKPSKKEKEEISDTEITSDVSLESSPFLGEEDESTSQAESNEGDLGRIKKSIEEDIEDEKPDTLAAEQDPFLLNLNRLAWLLNRSTSSCTAVCFIRNKVLVADNEIEHNTGSKKGEQHPHFVHIELILNELKKSR